MKKIKILVVTRSENIRRVMKDFFHTKRNLESSFIDDAEDYIALGRRFLPDIVVVDTKTKSVEAYQVCQDIKRYLPRAKQIVLTHSRDNLHLSKFIEVPVNEFIFKPLKLDILYFRIKKLTALPGRAVEILDNGGLILDDRSKQVLFDGSPLLLTATEYRLLRFMLLNKGKVLARNDILEDVWRHDTYVIDRSVDVYIARLRKKIAEKTKDVYIETKKGFGYTMLEKNSYCTVN